MYRYVGNTNSHKQKVPIAHPAGLLIPTFLASTNTQIVEPMTIKLTRRLMNCPKARHLLLACYPNEWP